MSTFAGCQRRSLSILLLSFLCFPGSTSGSEDRQRVFVRGLEAFDQAKTPAQFLEAARIFESILTGDYENGAVSYNLGNAYMRAGRAGHAIAAYREAQRLLPRDPYVQANLDAALTNAPDAVRSSEVAWWKRVLFWHPMLAQRERLGLAAGICCLAFMLASLRLLLLPAPGLGRTWLGWCAVLMLAAGLLFSVSAALGHWDEHLTRRAVVTEEAIARKGNGETYSPAFDRPLKEGAEGVMLEVRGGWVQVQFAGADAGWLPEKSVAIY